MTIYQLITDGDSWKSCMYISLCIYLKFRRLPNFYELTRLTI